ncbi:hypothetical protein [Nocardia mangyaensis]|uniref:hypothetical protein n=1 Tax=Nocardia mangyaensis TaxID=2213200 RepID=UPI0012EB3D73|nr:hypothetical protein [Nocardia mangyaensis]
MGLTPGVQAGLNGRQQQAGAEKQQDGLSHGGTDPAYIANMEAFEGFSHEEIYNAVQQMQPGVMQQFGDQWVSMSVEISGAVTGLMIQTARASSSLQGAAASAGEAAGKRFVTEVSDVSTVLSAVGRRVKAAAFGSEAVKAAVPPPVSSSGVTVSGDTAIPPVLEMLVDVSTPGTAADTAREKEERRQQAITAMNTTYKPTYQPSGDNVPSFVAPTQPGAGGTNGLGGGSGTSGSGSGGDGSDNGTGAGNGERNGGEGDGTEAASNGDETATSSGSGDGSRTGGSQGQDGDTYSASTNPAATTPASTNPAATTPGAGGSGGVGGSGGSGSGTGGALGSGAPAAGRALPGAGQIAATAGTSGAAGGAVSGAARGMGMPGMGAPGARGKNDEQSEHAIPDYLRRVQPELLGPDHDAVPGAIGADAPATRLADQGPGTE